MDCIKSRPLPTAQGTPGRPHPCPKPNDSFSRATTTALPRRSAVFLPIGEQRKQRWCLPPLSSCRCGVFIGERRLPRLPLHRRNSGFPPLVGLPSSRELFDAKLEKKTYRIITRVYE
ncbi:unnamed protein product [Musa acuminata subsp. malaccensis]|uniref:(wild Malaysian banana) hypothetical protein n=1 Tax=Musa acuminata subsp. malaccensis TaxID=214687 RepID=A0A8D7A982_MUSAM|nr:unnamed protein product [Musa acuminata subsp. malaccensis]